MSFRLRGVEITLSFWFFCGAVLLLTADRSGTAGLFFWAIALHEGGHLLYLALARLPGGNCGSPPWGWSSPWPLAAALPPARACY